MIKKISVFFLIVLIGIVTLYPQYSVPKEKEKNAILSTVRIITGSIDINKKFLGKGSGSGVLISPNGLIISNYHVVFKENGQAYSEIWAGLVDPRSYYYLPNKALKLKIISADKKLDLVLLKIQSKKVSGLKKPIKYPYLRIANSFDLFYGSVISIVGFPVTYGASTTVSKAVIIGIEEAQGWIKIEGSLMPGSSGGAAINSNGELIGIPTMVQTEQEIPFFGDESLPFGTVIVKSVGFLRSVSSIRRFLKNTVTNNEIQMNLASGISISGVVLDKQTRKPVPGCAIGILRFQTPSPEVYISKNDLFAYGKSGFDGKFTLNRLVNPNTKYQIKIVHPQYRTLIKKFKMGKDSEDFEILLIKE